jgi:hypothetical protein
MFLIWYSIFCQLSYKHRRREHFKSGDANCKRRKSFFDAPHIFMCLQNGAQTKSGAQLQLGQQTQPKVPILDDLGYTRDSNTVCKG